MYGTLHMHWYCFASNPEVNNFLGAEGPVPQKEKEKAAENTNYRFSFSKAILCLFKVVKTYSLIQHWQLLLFLFKITVCATGAVSESENLQLEISVML